MKTRTGVNHVTITFVNLLKTRITAIEISDQDNNQESSTTTPQRTPKGRP